MNRIFVSPPAPEIPVLSPDLHYTPTIPGGYHGLYAASDEVTRQRSADWGEYAEYFLLPHSGLPMTTRRNLLGTIVQASIVVNGRGQPTPEAMCDLILRLHAASLDRSAQIYAALREEVVSRSLVISEEQLFLLHQQICDEFEDLRGQLDPFQVRDIHQEIVLPLIRKHLQRYLE